MEKEKVKIKLKIKTGDKVIAIAGNAKGKTGLVRSVDAYKNRAFVEGLNMVVKHVKPVAGKTQAGSIVRQEASIHISNLMLIDPKTDAPTRVGRKLDEKGKLQRFSKKTGEFI